MTAIPKISILGAGCIGSYIAGCLLPLYKDTPARLSLIGREKQRAVILSKGLSTTDLDGNLNNTISSINFVDNKELMESTIVPQDILIVTVKCTAIAESLDEIKQLIDNDTIIIALQNGIGSETLLKQTFAENKILSGIVGFNVVEQSPSHFHRGTDGEILIESNVEQSTNDKVLMQLVSMLNQQKIDTELVDDFEQVCWGKLLLNLNNGINALSNIPLKAQLSNRPFRKLLAGAMQETLTTLKAANIAPAKLTKVAPSMVPVILKLPNFLFTRVANQMLAIDPLARSSMWYDVSNNKPTEIEFINGAVVHLAKQFNVKTPINDAIIASIRQAEKQQQGSPSLSAQAI